MSEEKIKIMVLDRGRVKVGYVSPHDTLVFHWRMRAGRTIRIWGSERGLEQIANEGPTANTILDDICDCDIPHRAVIEILEVDETAWQSHLKKNASSPPSTRRRTP